MFPEEHSAISTQHSAKTAQPQIKEKQPRIDANARESERETDSAVPGALTTVQCRMALDSHVAIGSLAALGTLEVLRVNRLAFHGAEGVQHSL